MVEALDQPFDQDVVIGLVRNPQVPTEEIKAVVRSRIEAELKKAAMTQEFLISRIVDLAVDEALNRRLEG